MLELIPHNAGIDFIGKRWFFFVLSICLVSASAWYFVSKGETKYGTDFSGGHEFLVTFSTEVDSEKIRTALDEHGIKESRVQAFQGGGKDFSIRLGGNEDVQAVRSSVAAALTAAFQDKYEIAKTDYVGPTVGNELRKSALLAIAVSLLGILIYIAFRFEFSVGLGTIIALFHDVVICTGVYLLAGHLISMSTLAGALTIVGYSVNDTVVVFDRVREERLKRKNYELGALINESLNFTLSRTIITHMLTLFSALALYIFGSGDIADLSLFLVVGIISGAYSTIFIASPIVLIWERFRGRAEVGVVSPRGALAGKA